MDEQSLFKFIRKNRYFRSINDDGIQYLLSISAEMNFNEDDFVFRQDDMPDYFYIIVEGIVEVLKPHEDASVGYYVIKTLTVNDIFGEMSFLNSHLRTAAIKAKTPLKVIAFPIATLHLEENTKYFIKISNNVSSEILDRLSDTTRLTVKEMEKELKDSKKITIYSVVIIFLMFVLFQVGMNLNYIFHGSDFCDAKYGNTKQTR